MTAKHKITLIRTGTTHVSGYRERQDLYSLTGEQNNPYNRYLLAHFLGSESFVVYSHEMIKVACVAALHGVELTFDD